MATKMNNYRTRSIRNTNTSSSIDKARSERVQTFQQLAMISSDSSSKDPSLQVFPDSDNPFHGSADEVLIPSHRNAIMNDAGALSTARLSHRIGSGSRGQWSSNGNRDTLDQFLTRQGSVAMKELDEVLRDENDDDDDMSVEMASEATYEHSVATAVTGHVSIQKVTPDNSPDERGRNRSDNDIQLYSSRDESPAPRRRNTLMCGAVGYGINDDLKGSFQDVNETLSQIFTTVKRFGPEEKDAVRETFRDAGYYMKEKMRAALRHAPGNRDGRDTGNSSACGSPGRVSMEVSPKRRSRSPELRENSASSKSHSSTRRPSQDSRNGR